jgi:hypothetical protein
MTAVEELRMLTVELRERARIRANFALPASMTLEGRAADALEAVLSERDDALDDAKFAERIAAKREADANADRDAALERVTALEKALRENFCPRPCNGRPDDLDVGDCVDFGECGCMNASALSPKLGEEKR